VSIDPERDTPERITQYIQRFNADFIGLRGEGDALNAVMSEFGIVAERRTVGDSPESYLIDHTASVFLINPDGQLQAQYLFGTASDDILHDVQVVLDAA
jgi:protein SCO1/2